VLADDEPDLFVLLDGLEERVQEPARDAEHDAHALGLEVLEEHVDHTR
jgi:hypothetical protein